MIQALGQLGAALFWAMLLFVVYTYFLYPALVAVAARLRPRPVDRRAGFTPSVSVVLAAFNEADKIGARILNLLEQDYPPELLDVIVVSDGSTDGTDALLEAMAADQPRLRVLTGRPNQGKAVCVNDGVAAARGEIIVFADARQRFAADAAARLAENFADPAVASVSGELMLEGAQPGVAAQVGLYWRYEKAIRRAESALGSMLGATGAIYAVRRAAYRPLPAGTLLDDFLTPMRMVLAGGRAIFDGRAVAWDQSSTQASQEMRRKVRTLAGNYQAFAFEPGLLVPWRNGATWWQVWSHKVFRLLVPFALVGVAAGSVLGPGWFYKLSLAGQALFYAAALAGWLGERHGRPVRQRLVSLAYTFCSLNLAAALGLLAWLRGTGSGRLWQKAYAPPPPSAPPRGQK